jgi:CRISPR type I-E-associated protein CasB/Cse2
MKQPGGAQGQVSTPTARPGPHAVRKAVGSAAYAMVHGQVSPGDVAALRRLEANDPSTPAFWKVISSIIAPHLELPNGGPALDRAERQWAVILNATAHLGGLHNPARPLGAALAAAGLSELRLSRLLRASGDSLPTVVRTTARYLAAKGEPADLGDLAELVTSDGFSSSEQVRRRIARSYYQSTNEQGD